MEKIEVAIKNGQSRDTGNIRHTRYRTKKKQIKNKTQDSTKWWTINVCCLCLFIQFTFKTGNLKNNSLLTWITTADNLAYVISYKMFFRIFSLLSKIIEFMHIIKIYTIDIH